MSQPAREAVLERRHLLWLQQPVVDQDVAGWRLIVAVESDYSRQS